MSKANMQKISKKKRKSFAKDLLVVMGTELAAGLALITLIDRVGEKMKKDE
ncbi:MAG: hypothetical protein MJ146_03055 [Clostridia bacterium]|nr:hypothetical protein [Clostridia bacterium]